ncbi:hypothetical protein DAI22_01g017308 [Oryza sativa Japonica Group]|nr:hypothetical protein DAI22_01g017308 [Oryza sativa Japonica Group]
MVADLLLVTCKAATVKINSERFIHHACNWKQIVTARLRRRRLLPPSSPSIHAGKPAPPRPAPPEFEEQQIEEGSPPTKQAARRS